MQNETYMHVRVNYAEAIEAKRGLLNSELRTLKILKRIEDYKKLQKEKASMRLALKKIVHNLTLEVNSLLSSFPKVDKEYDKFMKPEQTPIEEEKEKKITRAKSKIEKELLEVKEKLSKLG